MRCWLALFTRLMPTLHLLSSLIFAPVPAGHAVLRLAGSLRARRRGDGARRGPGVGMAAFFYLPSMLEMPLVSVAQMTGGDPIISGTS